MTDSNFDGAAAAASEPILAPGLYALGIQNGAEGPLRNHPEELRGPLDSDEWRSLSAGISALTQPYMALNRMRAIVHRNHEGFVSFCNSRSVTAASSGSLVNEDALIEADAEALNFVPSLHAFKDTAFHWVNGDELKKQAVADIYDGLRECSEGYLPWTLVRNYVTHRGPLYGAVSVHVEGSRLACDPAEVPRWKGWNLQIRRKLEGASDLADEFLTTSDAALAAIDDFYRGVVLLFAGEFAAIGVRYAVMTEKYGVKGVFGAQRVEEGFYPGQPFFIELLDMPGLSRALEDMSAFTNE